MTDGRLYTSGVFCPVSGSFLVGWIPVEPGRAGWDGVHGWVFVENWACLAAVAAAGRSRSLLLP